MRVCALQQVIFLLLALSLPANALRAQSLYLDGEQQAVGLHSVIAEVDGAVAAGGELYFAPNNRIDMAVFVLPTETWGSGKPLLGPRIGFQTSAFIVKHSPSNPVSLAATVRISHVDFRRFERDRFEWQDESEQRVAASVTSYRRIRLYPAVSVHPYLSVGYARDRTVETSFGNRDGTIEDERYRFASLGAAGAVSVRDAWVLTVCPAVTFRRGTAPFTLSLGIVGLI